MIRLTNYETKQKSPSLTIVCSQSKPPTTISYKPRYIMVTPPHGVTIVHDTVVFYVHTYECLLRCSFMRCIRGLSMVRTYNIYISTYRTSLSVYNIFHMINTLTASYAASMIDTTDYIMCGNGGRCRSYDHMIQPMHQPHDIPWL